MFKTSISSLCSLGLCALMATAGVNAAPATGVKTQLPVTVATCGLHLAARFVESAPKDRFQIDNLSSGRWSITSITFELETAQGKLIFDTDDGGGGREVFQPFEEVRFASDLRYAKLRRLSQLTDGGSVLNLDFQNFEPDERFAFTIDVDDQLAGGSQLGEIRVTGGELQGATLRFVLASLTGQIVSASTQFDKNNQAILKGRDCNQG